ncbi:MAG: UMP kinase [Nitrososphaeraceae archaeon]|nr:UMP kinase [Nitrososphaeraceae archaeon]HZB65089.1 UMP kinase [Nitrososphaeraceae archaeon]
MVEYPQKKRIVIKLSGSIFSLSDNHDQDSNNYYDIFKQYSDILTNLTPNVQLIVITGGGSIARLYINFARKLGLDEASLDLLGIAISRVNAKLLIASLGHYAYPEVPMSLDDVARFVESNKIIVSGGLHPGQSTNATSALIAEKTRASEFINATDVNGIYDSDPRKNKNAHLFAKIELDKLLNMLLKESSMAGEYDLLDIVALKVIERSKIRTKVILSNPKNISNTIQGRKYIGTELVL